MVRIELAPEVLQDFDRILEHLKQHQVADMSERIDGIVEALQILSHSPLIGRPDSRGQRELLIGQGSRACVARYQYLPDLATAFVLAIRSQRESGFKRDP
jgi:plasmid stabilization system protein ParE